MASSTPFRFDLSVIPRDVKYLCQLLGPQKSYVVGGIVRDTAAANLPLRSKVLTDVHGSDWDLATPLPPKEVMKRVRGAGVTCVPVGIEHGTVAAVISGVQYEITTFRHDIEYSDGRHPTVRFTDSLEEDLQRRDFTINAFALDVTTGGVIDLFGGFDDLQAGLVRTVGDPAVRFMEDHLRMARAARFAAKLQGVIEESAFRAVQDHAHLIRRISAERVRDEIMKLLGYEKPSIGFVLMHEMGLLQYILPELDVGFGVGQNRFHADDVAMHTLYTVDALSPKYPFYRFCALLHDLGKVTNKMYRAQKGDYVFYGHQYGSRRMGRNIMRRLRFSNKELDAATAIVENHMYNLKPDLSDGAIRRFVRKLGRENIDGFLRMRMADRRGNRNNDESYEKGIFHFVRTVRKIDREANALTVKSLRIGGHDLIRMGLPAGPLFSSILSHLLEHVLDNPSLNNREWLMARAREFAVEYKKTGSVLIPEPAKSTEGEENGAEGED